MTYLVAANTRDEQLHIRLKPDVKRDLKTVADLRGLTMSALVHSLIVQTIRSEKAMEPEQFRRSSFRGKRIKLIEQDELRKTGT